MMRTMLALVVLIAHRILVVHVVPRAPMLDDWGLMAADFGCLGFLLLVFEGWKK